MQDNFAVGDVIGIGNAMAKLNNLGSLELRVSTFSRIEKMEDDDSIPKDIQNSHKKKSTGAVCAPGACFCWKLKVSLSTFSFSDGVFWLKVFCACVFSFSFYVFLPRCPTYHPLSQSVIYR